ncbi:hypothetical protein BCL76_11538 [Streptomyces sp. CG 926]|nr:hypothetical protein [Streptomyces sp. CG 926]PWK64394.1 hypothetical protein BCL76_11538 [Streptomyces sp. CG 926]
MHVARILTIVGTTVAPTAVTEYATEIGELRNEVEAAVKKAVRHPEPTPE